MTALLYNELDTWEITFGLHREDNLCKRKGKVGRCPGLVLIKPQMVYESRKRAKNEGLSVCLGS